MGVFKFDKYEGLGNDFILVDETSTPTFMPTSSVRAMCDRNGPIGADGVIQIFSTPSPQHYRVQIFNADESLAKTCGNGLRCVAQWLLDNGKVSAQGTLLVETESMQNRIRFCGDQIEVAMGTARVQTEFLERPSVEQFVENHTAGALKIVARVDVGNPHLVLLSEHPEADAMRWGAHVQALFSDGINVGFAKIHTPHHVILRVYERGAGLTKACGSGALASVAALKYAGFLSEATTQVEFATGNLQVIALLENVGVYEMTLLGPAKKMYSGQLDLKSLV